MPMSCHMSIQCRIINYNLVGYIFWIVLIITISSSDCYWIEAAGRTNINSKNVTVFLTEGLYFYYTVYIQGISFQKLKKKTTFF